MKQSSGPVVSWVRIDQLTQQDVQDWSALEASSPSPNPFLTPTWVRSWYENRVSPSDQALLLVRDPKSSDLLGVAPLYRKAVRVGPLRVANRLIPVGAGGGGPFEIPGQLSAPGAHRDVTRAVVEAVVASDADWGAIALAPEQGWFEAEHLLQMSRPASFWRHVRPRACVVLRLSPSWEEVRAGLKRNLRESLRRSHNRLKRTGEPFTVLHRTGDDLDDATVRRLLDLHGHRAQNDSAGIAHTDAFAEPWTRRLLRTALPRLARESRASVFELELGGRVVASQLALHGAGSSYVHSSGFLPEVWELGAVTFLSEALVRHGIERGDQVVNFSPGPRVNKLRWSEECWVSNEFAFGAGSDALVRRHRLFLGASSLSLDLSGLYVHHSDAQHLQLRPH